MENNSAEKVPEVEVEIEEEEEIEIEVDDEEEEENEEENGEKSNKEDNENNKEKGKQNNIINCFNANNNNNNISNSNANNISNKEKNILNDNENSSLHQESIISNKELNNSISTDITKKNQENNDFQNNNKISKQQEEEQYLNILLNIFNNNSENLVNIINLINNINLDNRKNGFVDFDKFLNDNKNNIITENDINSIFMFIYIKLNYFKETNIELLKEGLQCIKTLLELYILSSINPKNTKYLEIIINNLYEKITENQLQNIIIDIINLLSEINTSKLFFDYIFNKLKPINKILVLKEYGIYTNEFLKKEVNSSNYIDLIDIKNCTDFAVKLLNINNQNLREISIKILCSLNKIIGPELILLLTDIKESTRKVLEKAFEKQNNESINDKYTEEKNLKVDISKELPLEKFRTIMDKGDWTEKKDCIDYIHNVLDNSGNKISVNGLDDLFEIIKDKLKDENKNLVKLIIQLLSHLINSLRNQIKKYSSILIYPLLLKLSDNNQTIREETINCINQWSNFQNFEVFASFFPSILIENDNYILRLELLNLLINNSEKINKNYGQIYFDQLIKALLLCLQDKNFEVRNKTEILIEKLSSIIPRENYINKCANFKPAITESLIKTIDKIFNFTIIDEKYPLTCRINKGEDENKKINVSLISPRVNKNSFVEINKINYSNSLTNLHRKKNKKNNLKKSGSTMENCSNKETKKKNNKRKLTQILQNNNSKSKVAEKTINKMNSGEVIISNKKHKDRPYCNLYQGSLDQNNYMQNMKLKKIFHKKHISQETINFQDKICVNKKERKIIFRQKPAYTKRNLSMDKRKKNNIKKLLDNEDINNDEIKINTSKSIFLRSYKIKIGNKQKRMEIDKKNNFYFEVQNFSFMVKLKENLRNIFINDFIEKLYSIDVNYVILAINDLIKSINESKDIEKIVDNMDMLLKILGVKLIINQTQLLIKAFNNFAEILIDLYKNKNFTFNDIESNVLLNILIDKLNCSDNNNEDNSYKLLLKLNELIENKNTINFLIHLFEYKNNKIKIRLIDIFQKIYDKNLNNDEHLITKIIKMLLKNYFESTDNKLKIKIINFLKILKENLGDNFDTHLKNLEKNQKEEILTKIQNLDVSVDAQLNKDAINYDIDTTIMNESKIHAENNFKTQNTLNILEDKSEDEIENNNNKKMVNKTENQTIVNINNMKTKSKTNEVGKIDNNHNIKKVKNKNINKKKTNTKDSVKKKLFSDNENNNNNKNMKTNKNLNVHSNLLTKINVKSNKKPKKRNCSIPSNNDQEIKDEFKTKKLNTVIIVNNIPKKSITYEELINILSSLNSKNDQLIDSMMKINDIISTNFEINKEVIKENIDTIIYSFINLAKELLNNIQSKIKLIKNLMNILNKICNIKELLSKISLNTEEKLIEFIISSLKYEKYYNLNENIDDIEWTIISKLLILIINNIFNYCNFTKIICILIQLQTKYRKIIPEYTASISKFLKMSIERIEINYELIDVCALFLNINNFVEQLIREENDIRLMNKNDQIIIAELGKIIYELTRYKKYEIYEDYNIFIKKYINNKENSNTIIKRWIDCYFEKNKITVSQKNNCKKTQ